MRIFYAVDSSPNPEFASLLWRANLRDSFVTMGHEVVEFDYDIAGTFRHLDFSRPQDRSFIEKNRPRLSMELVRQLRAAHAVKPVSLFFSYFYDACVEPAAIEEIKSLGIVTMNWFCNASYQFHLVREISPHYDWCLVPEKFRLSDYKAIGATPVYCQEAANPAVYKPCDVPRDLDVSFVGQCYGDRPENVRHLLDHGINVHVWGARWEYRRQPPHSSNPVRRVLGKAMRAILPSPPEGVILPVDVVGGVLSDEEMIAVFSRSKINLGFSSCGDTHRGTERILQIRLRDFEVPMSGGFYLVEQMDELAEFFEIDREIVCYGSRDELVDKIRFYLKNETAREAIRRAGYERARRDHTWQRRFEAVFSQIGLPSKT
ncbi:MAG: glycosyltransferase [Chthoniobacteraceae bacterium]